MKKRMSEVRRSVLSMLLEGKEIIDSAINSQSVVETIMQKSKAFRQSESSLERLIKTSELVMNETRAIDDSVLVEIQRLASMAMAIDGFSLDKSETIDLEELCDLTVALADEAFQSKLLSDKLRAEFVSRMHGAVAIAAFSEARSKKCSKSKESSIDKFSQNVVREVMGEVYDDMKKSQEQPIKSKTSIYDALSEERLSTIGMVKRSNSRPCSKCGCQTLYYDIELEKRICSPECRKDVK